MNVDDIVRQRIEAARRKAEQQQQVREEFAKARARGVARRHAQKLRRLAERGFELAPPATLFDNTSLAPSGA